MTWESTVMNSCGPQGYENNMRRSLQTIVLYEANRCILSALPTLRPFQRKLAYLDMANALVESLSTLLPHQKAEVLWRTGTSKEPMNAETAWKRRKLLNKELDNIKDAVSPLLAGRSHDEAIDAYIQLQFEAVTGNSCPVPRNWSHAHNNAIMCYRMYFRGDELNTAFPTPMPPKELYIATDKPASMATAMTPSSVAAMSVTSSLASPQAPVLVTAKLLKATPAASEETAPKEAADNKSDAPPEDRRLVLKEVREHLDLLKEFDGIIPAEDLVKRKRELFLAMPPAPPPAAAKRPKNTADDSV
mmetsp:Transcript_9678/g.16103  ORF Transcript_9678/g.16103 Transcript_9678/m.16103 type:complete len:303 (+) Transcript_9678:156-1064(+)|eukprot:CAMPEP_0119020632 /NCGR_PEP_ID=MMETSP1176-20130426/24441_1 /TAXON_ID=265551 /ORGANISM="Synedropsis recta cf, Strain CCMP1620" /LENGTH=302 /DNA_ID=CAMNT_0006975085 /DNA_START=312 /DNA_END=1220 /DNA_ORIENTATION=-